MATGRDGQVYATLLLSDTYLPGALVLAHSLLDNGTTRKLAVLVTEDTVSREAIAQLETVYHYVIPVPRIQNGRPQNLELMNRLDLHSAFTKIALWKQTQFSKIVYVDADIVAYRAPDELFDIDAPFSAAPDIGWPDIFNTGVMVLTPDLAEYDRLRAMADVGESFDGADQGLLNMHFGSSYNRISFTYNVTPSAHYQYIPAYKHFQSSINMVHFIGAQKPWFQGRPAGAPGPTSDTNVGPEVSPHDRMTGAWWDVYDRHYKPSVDRPPTPQQDAKLVQYLVKGEFDPYRGATPADSGHYESSQPVVIVESHHGPHVSSGVGGEQHPPSVVVVDHVPPPLHIPQSSLHQGDDGGQPESETIGRVHHPPPPPPPMEPVWDASRQAPPAHSKPEAPNFPDRKYEISLDSAPFVPPERYPSPPRGMWYDVPRERPEPQQQPKPIFPWENHRPPPTRVFTPAYVTPPLTKPEVRSDPAHKRPDVRLEPIIKRGTSPSRGDSELEPTSPASSTRSVRFCDEDEEIDIPAAGSPLLETGEEGTTPSELSVSPPPPPELIQKTPVPISEFWNASAAVNAWDEDPGIRRYIERVIDQTGLGGRRRSDVLRSRMVLDGDSVHLEEGPPPTRQPKHGFFKATDFPGPDERPSLPVTPALPTTPREGWRHSRQEEGEDEGPSEKSPPLQSGPLVEAEGVPRQSEWVCVHGRRWGPRDCLCVLANVLRYHKNPVERLARLAAEPEVILRRLSEDAEGVPDREVVESSEGLPGKRKGVGDGRSTTGVESVPEGTSAVQTGSGGQGKETPLVAPVPLKRRSADPVGNLEAASSGEGGPAGKKPTYSEVAGTTPGQAEGTAAKGNVAKERPAAREGVDVESTSTKGIAAEKGSAAKEGGSKAGAAATKGAAKGTATVKSTAAARGFAAKESALDIAARGRGTELLDI